MPTPYKPSTYWEDRLRTSFNLRGVGHRNFSESYNVWLYRRKERCIEARLHGVQLSGMQVLDVGCGTGFFVDWYLRRGAHVTGVDITEVSVERLRAKFPGNFHSMDIAAPDFAVSGPFDIVNMWDVMYHIVDPEAYDRALANIAAHLKPGGLFLTTDWFGAPSDSRVADHVQARCLATYQARLSGSGLDLVGVSPLYGALNKRILGGADNLLAPVYYLLDGFARRPSRRNLSLALWRKGPASG